MVNAIQEKIDLTYSKLGIREPFVAAVMTRVKREITDVISTAATDGKRVLYNPEFVDNLTAEQAFGLTLHEALHIILMHMWRRGDRDPKLWNIANDAIINAYIKNRGYSLPEGAVFIRWVRDDMDSEYVYRRLKQEQDDDGGDNGGDGDDDDDNDGGGSGRDSGGFDGKGDLMDAPDDATRADLEATIMASAQMAKDSGNGSSLIDKILKATGKSNVDWRNETRAMMTAASANDYTYRRFSRRFVGSGLYLPALYSDALGGIIVGIDVSASMSQSELNQIATELQEIVDDLRPEYVHVLYCDTNIVGEIRFELGDDIVLELKGGGGTRFKPVFDYVNEMDTIPVGIIYFTDMEGNLDECPEPSCPVIWANTSGKTYTAPFGVVTNVEI